MVVGDILVSILIVREIARMVLSSRHARMCFEAKCDGARAEEQEKCAPWKFVKSIRKVNKP